MSQKPNILSHIHDLTVGSVGPRRKRHRYTGISYRLELIEKYLVHSGNPQCINGLIYVENIKKFIKELLKIESIPVQNLALLSIIMFDSNQLQKYPSEKFARMFEGISFQSFKPVMEFGEMVRELLPENIIKIILKKARKRDLLDYKKMAKSFNDMEFSLTDMIPVVNPFFENNMSTQNASEFIDEATASLALDFNEIESMTNKFEDDTDILLEYAKFSSNLPDISFEEFCDTLLQILSSPRSNNELQNELFDMLGFDSFQFITTLLNNREHYSQPNTMKKILQEQQVPKCKSSGVNVKMNGPSVATQVTIMSEEEKALLKKLRKMEKRGLKEDQDQVAHEFEEARCKPIFKKISVVPGPEMQNVHDEGRDIHTKAMVCGKAVSIPLDAIRKTHNNYEEIIIPPRERTGLKPISPVEIDTLDPLGKMVFKDITAFNQIQSEVYPIAYHTNENMLICAPTGAGKTNIALMAIVKQINMFIEDHVVRLDKFKIVYICPMKALATEMTANFSNKLKCLGITVKEITGDTQLSRKEIMETQILVTTPEKWDVITRKGTGDTDLTDLLKLLIIDEVHLLNSDRGHVIEALVARTLRQVVSTQNMIRIIGLSATLPSYMDVALFLRVNPEIGLFYFDSRYRSVPLTQTFIGVKSTRLAQVAMDQDLVCFEKVVQFLRDGHQVMVFVHARNQTVKTAEYLKQTASKQNKTELFQPKQQSFKAKKFTMFNSKNSFLTELFSRGLGIHHAGMPRCDRLEVERAFTSGAIRVLVCTATLAWGVNLPAHGVIIKGTTLYDTKKCSYVDLDILDVMQIFGRAGRPQYDTSGSGIIITTQDKVHHYLSLLTNQVPIESQFLKSLADNLNAEIVLGTVSNIQEGVEWMTFTYLYRRMHVNPQVYGLNYSEIYEDPDLRETLLKYIHNAAKTLDKEQLIRYSPDTGDLMPTNMGRTASYFYVTLSTIEKFNEFLTPHMTDSAILNLMCLAGEFEQIQVRQEELEDLDKLIMDYCIVPINGGPEHTHGKVNILMQTYLSRGYIKSLSLASDMEYITQSATRIARALFDIAIHKNIASLASVCLTIAQMFERRMWSCEHPMKQFSEIPSPIIHNLSDKNIGIEDLREMDEKEIGNLIRNNRIAGKVKRFAEAFPFVEIETTVKPITRGVIRVNLFIKPMFTWTANVHGSGVEVFWVWVEDPETDNIYHSETFTITKSLCMKGESIELVFTIPLADPQPSQYLVRVSSDHWLHSVDQHAINLSNLTLPDSCTSHTPLLELQPLEKTVLNNPVYESLYKFSHFNPVQTQIFHCLYHTDNNVLLGAPTGSGKTIAAEICIFRLLNMQPHLKVVYIAPLKALVRERVIDWKQRFEGVLNKKVVEITGDVTPSIQAIKNAAIIITTPEKWDGMSRGWQNRDYIREVGLMIIDEIHLLGEDRGPVLEVIVSRTNFISNQTGINLRIVGLSTAMANAKDLAHWLGIGEMGMYNFRPSVRPVPLDVHIAGFPGKHYCPRMISMNRPTYQAIRQYAPDSPTLVFCSSRKQTRLTAFGLITYLVTDSDPKQWLRCDQQTIDLITANVLDKDLKHFLNFGIGIHHAGLQERDRKTVEELFVNQKIQVLIATATLAWGVNFPAHLVVVKGTEYFDGHIKKYIDMPITDVLQMMGRAGRPQFDTSGVACVFVHDIKKNFYKKFLYEPFPVESNLLNVLPDHINAEIAVGTVSTKKNLMEYMTWTYFFRRLLENPTYYGLTTVTSDEINSYLSELIDSAIDTLENCKCVITVEEDDETIYEATFFGQVASYYYLSHKTLLHFADNLSPVCSLADVIEVMCFSDEYAIFPVRHNEDKINIELMKLLDFKTSLPPDSSHLKVMLLMYAYLSDVELPNQEYVVDCKSVLDQALRILQGMVDVTANGGWLSCTLKIIIVMQMIIQGRWLNTSDLLGLPHMNETVLSHVQNSLRSEIPQHGTFNLMALKVLNNKMGSVVQTSLKKVLTDEQTKHIRNVLNGLPLIAMEAVITEMNTGQKHNLLLNNSESYTFNMKSDLEIQVNLFRKGSSGLVVQTKKFPKQKDESWILCCGRPYEDELICMKRITVKRNALTVMKIKTPANQGQTTMSIYLLSDSYMGLDQQYDIQFNIV